MKNLTISASIAAFFVPKQDTVDGILADLNKKIDQLSTLFNSRMERANDARVQAEQLQKEAVDHEVEATRAISVRDKIKALLS